MRGGEHHYHLGVGEIIGRLRPDYWWTDPLVAWDGTAAVRFAVLLAAVFVGAAMLLTLAPRMFPTDDRWQQRFRTASALALGFASTGLLLLLFRWQATPFFGRRIWFMLWLALLLVAMGGMLMRSWQERQRPSVAVHHGE